jgi:trigger factor
LKVDVSDIKSCVKKLRIEIPAEMLDKEIDEAYKRLNRSVKIHGFRKGKAPRKVLEHHYSKSVESDVLQKIVPDTYNRVIKEYNIQPVNQPYFEDVKIEHGEPLSFNVTVETLPDITLKDFSTLEFTRTIVKVTDEDVEKELKRIQEMQAEFESSDSLPVDNYDHVIFDFEGFSNNVSIKKGMNTPVFVGSHTFLPEFEKELIGLKKGDIKEIKIIYPPDYSDKELKGREVNFKVLIKEIKKRRLKPIDDNFAKEVGGYQNLVELRKRIREDLEKKEGLNADSQLRSELIDKLIAINRFEVPPVLIEKEIDSMAQRAYQQLASQGIDVNKTDVNIQEIRERFRESAEKSVRGEIIIDKIVEKESVTVSDAEVDDEIKRYALSIKENFHVLKRKMENNSSIKILKNRILIDKAFDAIIKQLIISDISIDKESEAGK